MSAPHAISKGGLEQQLDLSIGCLPFRFVSADEALLQAAAERYAAFAARQADPFAIYLKDCPGAGARPADFTYEFAGSGLRTRAQESCFTGVRNEYALDSLLRVLLSWRLLSHSGFLLHAATVIRNGKAQVFTGKSGAGKTTVASLAPEGSVLTDEISLVRREDGVWRAYGTPFWGEFRAAGANTSAPVAGIFRLIQATENRAALLRPREILRMLLPNVLFFSSEPAANRRLLDIISLAASEISAFDLAFRKNPSFWEALPT